MFLLKFHVWENFYSRDTGQNVLSQSDCRIFLINYIVKEGTYYANYKKFVLPSPLFMLELRAGCHSQLKMVSEVMANILAFVDHLC